MSNSNRSRGGQQANQEGQQGSTKGGQGGQGSNNKNTGAQPKKQLTGGSQHDQQQNEHPNHQRGGNQGERQ